MPHEIDSIIKNLSLTIDTRLQSIKNLQQKLNQPATTTLDLKMISQKLDEDLKQLTLLNKQLKDALAPPTINSNSSSSTPSELPNSLQNQRDPRLFSTPPLIENRNRTASTTSTESRSSPNQIILSTYNSKEINKLFNIYLEGKRKIGIHITQNIRYADFSLHPRAHFMYDAEKTKLYYIWMKDPIDMSELLLDNEMLNNFISNCLKQQNLKLTEGILLKIEKISLHELAYEGKIANTYFNSLVELQFSMEEDEDDNVIEKKNYNNTNLSYAPS